MLKFLGTLSILAALSCPVFANPDYGKDLTSQSGYVRQQAIQNIAAENDTRYLSQIEHMAYDGDVDIRVTVAWALGQFKSPSSVSVLDTLLRDTKENVRHAAAVALGSIPGEQSGSALVRATYDSSADVVKAAADSLGRIKYSEAWQRLSDLMSFHPNADVRNSAALAISSMGAKVPVNLLASGLYDKDARVRAAAVENVGITGGDSAFASLLDTIKDNDVNVRKNTLTAMGKTKDPRAVAFLIDGMQSQNDEIADCSADAMVSMGTKQAVDETAKLAKNGIVPERSFDVLGRMGEIAVSQLTELAKGPSNVALAVEALGNTRSKNAVEPVILALENQDEAVSNAAVDAIAKLPITKEDIEKCIKSENASVRKGISKALGKMPYSQENSELLIGLLSDEDEGVVSDASRSLALYKDSVRDRLFDVVRKAESDMQAIGAINAISLMGPESIPVLKEAMANKDYAVKLSAVLALGQMKVQDDEELVNSIINILQNTNDTDMKRACAWSLARVAKPSDRLINILVTERVRAASQKNEPLREAFDQAIKALNNN